MASRPWRSTLTTRVLAGLLAVTATLVPGPPSPSPAEHAGAATRATTDTAGWNSYTAARDGDNTARGGAPGGDGGGVAGTPDGALTGDGPAADRQAGAELPAEISPARPATIVTTSRNAHGRPVVEARTVTDSGQAGALVRAAQASPAAVGVEVAQPVALFAADPMAASVWALKKLAAQSAWQVGDGTGTVVAVLDTGVDGKHPDLAGAVLPGRDFVAKGDGWKDAHGHGTHVAGTIAAVRDNGIGVVGLAPGTRILPGRVIDGHGKGTTVQLAQAIMWAADRGADVINMSLGYRGRSTAVSTAIKYARSKGVVVVAAAGNSRAAGSPTTYPAADSGVIGVAATDPDDGDASFSNRADYVDLAAPGVGIRSTVPGRSYAYKEGTSMAAPQVAAAAAMLRSAAPFLTPDQVQEALAATAVDLGRKGRDTTFGYGRIAPAAALHRVLAALSDEMTPTVTSSGTPGPVAYGSVVTTTFTVSGGSVPWAGKPVSVCVAVPPGSAYSCTATTIDGSGQVRHTRNTTAPYAVRLQVTATSGSRPATSDVHRYDVRAVASVQKTGPGTAVAAVAAAPTQTVTVQRWSAKGWKSVSAYKATATKTLTGLSPGVTYRLSVAAGPGVGAAVSGTVLM